MPGQDMTLADAGSLDDEFVAGFEQRVHPARVNRFMVRGIVVANVLVIRPHQLRIADAFWGGVQPRTANRDSGQTLRSFERPKRAKVTNTPAKRKRASCAAKAFCVNRQRFR